MGAGSVTTTRNCYNATILWRRKYFSHEVRGMLTEVIIITEVTYHYD